VSQTILYTDDQIVDFIEHQAKRWAESMNEINRFSFNKEPVEWGWAECIIGVPSFSYKDETFRFNSLRESVIDALTAARIEPRGNKALARLLRQRERKPEELYCL